jgi:hypothetical protein
METELRVSARANLKRFESALCEPNGDSLLRMIKGTIGSDDLHPRKETGTKEFSLRGVHVLGPEGFAWFK